MAANRHSIYSTTSTSAYPSPGSTGQQVTTSSLLSTLHNAYQNTVPYQLDASTTLVVNSGKYGSRITTDEPLGVKAWEHARRRAEDQTIVLGSLHAHTPSVLIPILSTFPTLPDIVTTAVTLVQSFTSALTPFSPYPEPLHHGLAVSLQLNLTGSVVGASISLSTVGLNTQAGLLNIPAQRGYRAFDVFYYLLSAASTAAEREVLSLQLPEKYTLLARSGTYSLPSYLPTADDSAAAEDFRANLRAIGIKGSSLRGLLSILAAILKLGNAVGLLVDEEVVDEVCEEVAGLLGVEPEILAKKLGDGEREAFIEATYEAIVDWIICRANAAITEEFVEVNRRAAEGGSDAGGDTVQVTILELPDEKLSKALCLRGVFDDDAGINSEMKADGIEFPPVSSSVLREVRNAVAEAEREGLLGMTREKEYAKDKKEGVVEKVGREVEEGGFLNTIFFAEESTVPKMDIAGQLAASRAWWHLSISPSDGGSNPNAVSGESATWTAAVVSRQLRGWRLPEWANRRTKHLDFTADFDVEEFWQRYATLGCSPGKDGVETWILERGWSNGEVIVGSERIWMRESSWWEAEQMLDRKPGGVLPPGGLMGMGPMDSSFSQGNPNQGYFDLGNQQSAGSRDQLLRAQATNIGGFAGVTAPGTLLQSAAPPASEEARGLLGKYADDPDIKLDPEIGGKKKITTKEMSKTRRIWVVIVWALTFWIPSFILRFVGRMKRPDVRMAWREKLVICFFIFLLNGAIVFWITYFALLLCPDYDKAWSGQDISYHTGTNDFWVSIHGKVYDISKFWQIDHSKMGIATKDVMQQFAGLDLSLYFPIPIDLACSGLDLGQGTMTMITNDTADNPIAMHSPLQYPSSSIGKDSKWYLSTFLPRMKQYLKGDLVISKSLIAARSNFNQKPWGMYGQDVIDLTDYVKTTGVYSPTRAANTPNYWFLNQDVVDVFVNNPGEDITDTLNNVLHTKITDKAERDATLRCLKNAFYVGRVDFRTGIKCQANGIILAVFAGIITAVILIKFLAALQLGSKRKPALQDKFVICQIPAYTEGEDSLRKALDSLTALQYDNKRKLLCVICDGMVVGGGNDRPTPSIVLEILGVDPKVDPPALPFKSVGEGSQQLNYGKVYSGLYEYEGCVVPYLVIVKVGKPTETSKPGNRGKRDSQILLLNFLNRVHHRTAMSPLELEMFHQINNIIGVDPELYEYLLMVDADTNVKEDALNRLIAACANDAKIAGICGETSLENEQRSWWTMIQVYEYYISHHLAKSFESIFGSVTCLPGCFCMYRLRTPDKGRPLIISDKVINEYSDGCVDTLHKKNLLSLGEDRFLTTLMTKHFPRMSYKFLPDAYALTAAPETWSVLLSQRRRWINSTIHNLGELMMLKEMCGFCCFSMRFVVFIDLTGTIILPATCVYIGYLIYRVATKSGPLPLLSIIMISAVYGLQAIIFLVKRQWQHIGWMIIYILSYPIYSFILPIYSFWNQDNFSWGNTRIVLGESGTKQVIATEDEGFDPKSIPLQTWDEYAAMNNLPGRRGGGPGEKFPSTTMMGPYDNNEYEMDDIHSVYSSAKPASTILTGLPQFGYMPSASPGPQMINRQSTYSAYTSMTGLPQYNPMAAGPPPGHGSHQRLLSMGNRSNAGPDYWQDPMHSNRSQMLAQPSMDNLAAMAGAPSRLRSRSPLGYASQSRPVSQVDFTKGPGMGYPDDESIISAIRTVLADVDLDTVTKKQVKQKVETILQTELTGERKQFLDKQIDTELANM